MNKENLLKLAKFLDELPEDYKHFDMNEWVQDPDGYLDPAELESTNIEACGYAACAVGHAPQALGVRIEELQDLYNWCDFIDLKFKTTWPEESWMFGDFWEAIDNTPKGAAKRIRYAVENGVPEGFTSESAKDFVTLYEDY